MKKFVLLAWFCLLTVAVHAEQVQVHITGIPTHAGDWQTSAVMIDAPDFSSTSTQREPEQRFAADKVTTIRTAPAGYRYTWKMVMLIYPSIDCVTIRNGVSSRFTYTMTPAEIQTARDAMASAVTGIYEGSNHQAHVTLTIVEVGRTLTSLAQAGDLYYWPDATITDPEMTTYCKNGQADSVMIYWPTRNHATGASLYNDYWGLSYGEIQWYSSHVGYSTVANILSPNHPGYYPGEVFIHEWLHPTGGFYEDFHGAQIPNLDASSTYRPCPDCPNYALVPGDGHMNYYRDYVTGSVWNPAQNRYEGITAAHWQAGTPTNTVFESSVDNWSIY